MNLDPTRSEREIRQFRTSLDGRHVLVIGAGRSGIAAVRRLLRCGARVRLADIKSREDLPEAVEDVEGLGAEFIAQFESLAQAPGTDLIIPSPGVPTDHRALVEAREKDVETWGTLELGYRLYPGPVIAITGTNGKGTTCCLLANMLEEAGMSRILAGNIGCPLAAQIDAATTQTPAVVEVSSFQLETVVDFRPRVATVLNIAPEHLNRHQTFQEYSRIKARIFENQRPDDFVVVNTDDRTVRRLSEVSPGTALRVSLRSDSLEGAVVGGHLTVRLKDRTERICPVDDLPLRGEHHLTNALVAAAIARLAGVSVRAIGRAIRAYKPPRHHMEVVRNIEGVTFINDSKASNPQAAAADLAAMDGPFVAIVGGRDKGGDFGELGRVLRERAQAVVLIGEAADRIAAEIGERKTIERARSLPEAIERAADLARSGDAVILAPACSSFDMFRDYAHRGDVFSETVHDRTGE